MNNRILPDKLRILGFDYRVEECDRPSDVDFHGRASYWGCVDYWTHTIRIFTKERDSKHILQTVLHEVLHAVSCELKIKSLGQNDPDKDQHDDLDILALALADFVTENPDLIRYLPSEVKA